MFKYILLKLVLISINTIFIKKKLKKKPGN